MPNYEIETWRCPDCKCLVVVDEEDIITQEALTVGELSLNINSGSAIRAGEFTKLTPGENAVLARLMTRPNQIAMLDRLIEDVYSSSHSDNDYPETYTGINSLRVIIHRLRKKLGADAIDNCRSYGYKLGQTIIDAPN